MDAAVLSVGIGRFYVTSLEAAALSSLLTYRNGSPYSNHNCQLHDRVAQVVIEVRLPLLTLSHRPALKGNLQTAALFPLPLFYQRHRLITHVFPTWLQVAILRTGGITFCAADTILKVAEKVPRRQHSSRHHAPSINHIGSLGSGRLILLTPQARQQLRVGSVAACECSFGPAACRLGP